MLQRGFQRLQRLGVMVGDQRHGVKRIGFYQRAAEDLAHVVITSLTRRFMKIEL